MSNHKDRTAEAVRQQVKLMGAEVYEVGIRNRERGTMLERRWTPSEIITGLSFLKARNRAGDDIYIRPEGSTGLLLIDDLTPASLLQLEQEGLRPVCVTETSESNYQVWLRVSRTPIDKELATSTAQVLARYFNADIASADWRHFGRLAGFTNRKPERLDKYGRAPFVLLRESGYGVTPRASELLEAGQKRLIKRREAQQRRLEILKNKSRPDGDEVAEYKKLLSGIYARFGAATNLSIADWQIGIRMAEMGYKPDDIKNAILNASPKIEQRKAGHIEHYIDLTVGRIFGLVTENEHDEND